MRRIRLSLSTSLLLALSAAAQHNGTVAGTPAFSSVKFGGGLTTLSDSNYVSLPAGWYQPANSGAVTCETWLSNTSSSGLNVAVTFGSSGADGWMGVNGTQLQVAYNGQTILPKGTIDASVHHVEFDGNGTTAAVFLDGNYVDTTPAPNGSATLPGASSTGLIGRYSATGHAWQGGIGPLTCWPYIRHAGTASFTPPASAYSGSEGMTSLYNLASNANDSASQASTGTITVSPATFLLGTVTAFTMTGSGTGWNSATLPTLTSAAGAYISNIVVTGQQIAGTLYPGTASGTATLGDSSDSATTAVTLTANTTTVLGFLGDSLTAGLNGSNAGTATATRIATVVAGVGPGAVAFNQGVSGNTTAQILARLSNFNALYQAGKTNYAIVTGGTNNLKTDGVASTVAGISAVTTALANAGWKVIYQTITPVGSASGQFPSTFDALRDQVNALVRTQAVGMEICALADVAQDARIGQDGQEYNPAYYGSDTTHPVDAGYVIEGQTVLQAIQAAAVGCITSRTGLTF